LKQQIKDPLVSSLNISRNKPSDRWLFGFEPNGKQAHVAKGRLIQSLCLVNVTEINRMSNVEKAEKANTTILQHKRNIN
jgi:hypothetical protein